LGVLSAGGLPNLGGLGTSFSGPDAERLRRYLHDVLDTALAAFSPKAGLLEDRAVVVRGSAPVQAGEEARVTLRVANEDPADTKVNLYSSNFVADNGGELSSSYVVFTPRTATIAAKSEAMFELRVRVPRQALPGVYSGLIQASGSKYLKAIVSIEVK
jgi:hypothetical protein